ncbi:MAG TPA: hypothetical protein IAA46_10665 [Candidatus Gemmiger avium]|nr:hypothetical protein [Candidatus Gemmiger avium]
MTCKEFMALPCEVRKQLFEAAKKKRPKRSGQPDERLTADCKEPTST